MINPTSTPKATDAVNAILRARESGEMDAAGTIEDLVELIDRITSSDEGDGEALENQKLVLEQYAEAATARIAELEAQLTAKPNTEVEAILRGLIDLEAPAEHLPEPISSDLLSLIDKAAALLSHIDTDDGSARE